MPPNPTLNKFSGMFIWRSTVEADARGSLQGIHRVFRSQYADSDAEIRGAIREYLNSADGCFPWQLQHVYGQNEHNIL